MTATTRVMAPAAVALLLFAAAQAVADPGNDNRAPDVSAYPDLMVPEGHKVAFYAYAEGLADGVVGPDEAGS